MDTGTNYPAEFRHVTQGRARKALGDAAGLTQFGVRLTRLAPGAASALRHWHISEDEFIYVLEGTPTLITDAGEEQLNPGDAIAIVDIILRGAGADFEIDDLGIAVVD